MAEGADEESKTEEPTSKRRQQARDQGSVCQSAELNGSFVLFVGIVVVRFLGPWMLRRLKMLMVLMMDNMGEWSMLTIPEVHLHFLELGFLFFVLTLPFLLIIASAGYLISKVQVGNVWTAETLKWKWSKMIQLKMSELNIFKPDKLVKIAIDLAKLMIIAPVAYYTVKGYMGEIIPLMDKTVEEIFGFIFMVGWQVMFRIAFLLLILGIIDYIKTWFKYEKDLMMEKWEVKQERKDLFGDPMIKGWQHQSFPTAACASGSSIIITSDSVSGGTPLIFRDGLTLPFLYPYFLGISSPSEKAVLSSFNSPICEYLIFTQVKFF